MPYSESSPFHGDTKASFGLAESALTALGFRITGRTAESIDLVGPGMNSSRESALVGASSINISRARGELSIMAELGGVERMSRFVTLFPIGLCLFLAVVLSVVFGVLFGAGVWVTPVVAVTAGNALLWLLIGPMIARHIRARTCRALDALLANLVAVGQSKE